MKNFDKGFLRGNKKFLAGTDEAGRGPLAGPVVGAAVILPPDFFDERINDSKQLTAKLRDELFEVICKNAIAYSYTSIYQKKIDKINILTAALSAMKQSVKKLSVQPDIILVDGNKTFSYDTDVISIVKGDSKSLAIASASIIAKVVRDRIMKKLSKNYPQYNWVANKGYPTKEHIEAILKHGPCKFHRKTFLKKIYDRDKQFHLAF